MADKKPNQGKTLSIMLSTYTKGTPLTPEQLLKLLHERGCTAVTAVHAAPFELAPLRTLNYINAYIFCAGLSEVQREVPTHYLTCKDSPAFAKIGVVDIAFRFSKYKTRVWEACIEVEGLDNAASLSIHGLKTALKEAFGDLWPANADDLVQICLSEPSYYQWDPTKVPTWG